MKVYNLENTPEVCTRFYTLIFRRETFLPKQSRSAAAFAVRWFHLVGVNPRASRAKNSGKFQTFFENSEKKLIPKNSKHFFENSKNFQTIFRKFQKKFKEFRKIQKEIQDIFQKF